ncbi:hypothetical protein F443_06862, partial [Phytophthora nicotianae P1569]
MEELSLTDSRYTPQLRGVCTTNFASLVAGKDPARIRLQPTISEVGNAMSQRVVDSMETSARFDSTLAIDGICGSD